MGALGLLAQAVISWLASLGVTPLTAKISAKWVWFGSQILFAVLLASTWTVAPGQAVAGVVIFAAIGTFWATNIRVYEEFR